MRRAFAWVFASSVVGFSCASGACGGVTQGDAFGGGSDGGGSSSDGSSSSDSSATSDGSGKPYDTSCKRPGECVLSATGCCGIGCGTQPGNLVAIHRGQEHALITATCNQSNPACPDCWAVPIPNKEAFCRDQKCVIVDIPSDVVSACKRDDDCIIRPGDCCPCGEVDPSTLVAINRSATTEYQGQVCDPNASCSKCAWALPTNLRAVCHDNHCAIDKL